MDDNVEMFAPGMISTSTDLQPYVLRRLNAVASTGVPVLLLPYGWKRRGAMDNIVIAWKSSREATRAVHDAMPLLARAKKVTAFTFAPESQRLG